MLRGPLSLPLSKSYGARPTRAAICLRLIFPSSGNRAMSVKASTGPTPGIEVSIALSESHIGGNHLGQALVEEADIGLQSHLAAFAEPPQPGIFEMSRLVLGRNVLVAQLSPHRHDLGEPFDRSVPLHNSCWHDRDILCDQPGIEAIVLGQH